MYIGYRQASLSRQDVCSCSSERQGKLFPFYSGEESKWTFQCPGHGKTLQPCSEESVYNWKRLCTKRLDKVTFRVRREGPGCNASERTGSLVKSYEVDESLFYGRSQHHRTSTRERLNEPKYSGTSGVLAATWSERGERNLGDPPNPHHPTDHLGDEE